MKKAIILFEFFFILSFLILPPIFVAQQDTASINKPFISIIPLAFSILLYCQKKADDSISKIDKKNSNSITKITNIGQTSFCFGLLCITAAVFEFLGIIFKIDATPQELSIKGHFIKILILFINIVIPAFYEEILYRQYFPDILKKFSNNRSLQEHKKIQKITNYLSEAVPLLCFALGHRYLGILGVANAFVSGIFLRRCLIKTGSVWYSFTAHCLYNIGAFVLYSILK